MNRRLMLFASFTLFVSLTGCLPFVKMESGRVIGKDRFSVGAIASSYSISSSGDKSFTIPYGEFQVKEGITEKFEISGGLNSVGFVIINGKYQIVGDQKSFFALSLGIGSDILVFIPKSDSNIKKNLKLSIPVFTSYHFTKKTYLFIAPQFSKQIIFDKKEDNINFLGISLGLGIYIKNGEINLGGGYFAPINELQSNIDQIGVSYRHFF